MDHGRRTRLLTAVTLALVFVSGGITGYAAAARDSEAAEPPPPSRRGFVYEEFHPNEVQQQQIDSILAAHRKGMAQLNSELGEIRQRYQMASDSISLATGDAIALVFPPDVAAEYSQRLAARRAEWMQAREDGDREARGDRR